MAVSPPSAEDEEYERALAALSSLISGRQRKDSGQWQHAFEMMQSYLEASACPVFLYFGKRAARPVAWPAAACEGPKLRLLLGFA